MYCLSGELSLGEQQLPVWMVSPSACREPCSQCRPGQALPCCGAFLLGLAEASLHSELISEPCPHSTRGGHRVCRHWRNVLSALAKLHTRGSSPIRFLGYSLEKEGREKTEMNFFAMDTSDAKCYIKAGWYKPFPLFLPCRDPEQVVYTALAIFLHPKARTDLRLALCQGQFPEYHVGSRIKLLIPEIKKDILINRGKKYLGPFADN